MAVKFEKITLWTASETYGVNDRGLSALDYIIPALDKIEEGKVLDYDTEDYKLVKVEEAKAEATIASSPELLEALEHLMALEGGEAGSYDIEHLQQRANQVWQDASDAVAKAKGTETG